MRVVLDTNILISAVWKPGGLEARVVELALSGALTACVSGPVSAEYRAVLGRKKFESHRREAEEMLRRIERCTTLVEPSERLTAASDEDDNRLLECAVAAGARYLITGNLRHYPAECETTKVVNARGFLEGEFGLPQLDAGAERVQR